MVNLQKLLLYLLIYISGIPPIHAWHRRCVPSADISCPAGTGQRLCWGPAAKHASGAGFVVRKANRAQSSQYRSFEFTLDNRLLMLSALGLRGERFWNDHPPRRQSVAFFPIADSDRRSLLPCIRVGENPPLRRQTNCRQRLSRRAAARAGTRDVRLLRCGRRRRRVS